MTNSGEERRAEKRWQSRCPAFLVGIFALAMVLQLSGCGSALHHHGSVHRLFMGNEEKTLSLNAEGVSLLNAGELNKAERRFFRALDLSPNNGAVRNNLGILHYERRFYPQAIDFFNKAAELMPEDPRPRNNLGQCYEAMGDFQTSEAMYNEAHQLAPSEAEYLGNLVRTRIRAGKMDDVTASQLSYLLAIEPRAHWRVWAQRQLTLVMGVDSRTLPVDLGAAPELLPSADFPPTARPPESIFDTFPAESDPLLLSP